ncbi:MAG: endonuclease MutS2 [Syntrophomonadaceae bacterium]|jgi:DNA mismatch repair protein MutS2
MDKYSITKLEFDKIQQQLAQLCYSQGGRNKALVMKPSNDVHQIEIWLDQTGEAMEALRFGDTGFLSELPLIDPYLAKARADGILYPNELYDIKQCLYASRMAVKYAPAGKYPCLGILLSGLKESMDLENKLQQAINEEGELRDDASPTLKSIRNQINTSRTRIRDYLQDFIRSGNNQKLLQDALVTERDGRYVIPVKQEYRYEVKGIIHDESASGATVYIEPLAVVDHNNRIRSLQMEEKREVERILRDLTRSVAVFADELAANMQVLSEFDFILARARMAYKQNAFRPQTNTRGIVEINRGRHPLLGEQAVPINIELGKKFDILVITGPNTGGKTVALKTIGLLTLMTMCGMFIPARENSFVAVYKSIYVDIGDEQSIEQSLSTFSSHMKNIIEILERADNSSLVLIDELGAGTDPVEGAALARVILEELKRNNSRAIVTTHQSELKNYAYQNERVENACVEFDPVNLKPTYKLTIGMPGQSNAFQIARRLGLKEALVKRAQELVPRSEMELDNMIRQLKESRQQYEDLLREAEVLRRDLVQQRDTLESERLCYQQEQEEILAKARQEAEDYLRLVREEANDAIKDLKELIKDREILPKRHEVEKKRQRLKQLEQEVRHNLQYESITEDEIRPGDYVHVKSIDQKGYVLEGPNSQGEVLVQVGILKLSVKQSQVSKAQSPEEKKIKWRNKTYLEKAQHISKEIDVRGLLAEDALLTVDRYLEDAILAGLNSVRVIHGKGTGALRKAIRGYLKDHRYVKTYRDGFREEGGYGVTVVELH